MHSLFPTRSLATALLLQDDEARQALHTRLDSVLHVLYAVAIVLGVVLIAVTITAVRAYRKSKTEKDLPS